MGDVVQAVRDVGGATTKGGSDGQIVAYINGGEEEEEDKVNALACVTIINIHSLPELRNNGTT